MDSVVVDLSNRIGPFYSLLSYVGLVIQSEKIFIRV